MAKPGDGEISKLQTLTNETTMKPTKYTVFLDIPDLDAEDYESLEEARKNLIYRASLYPEVTYYVCCFLPKKTSDKIMLELSKSDCKTVSIWYYLQTGELPENTTEYRIQWIDYLLARRSTN